MIARNVPLPRRKTSMDAILSGAEDSRLVDAEGVIHTASVSRGVAPLTWCTLATVFPHMCRVWLIPSVCWMLALPCMECAGRSTMSGASFAAFSCLYRVPTTCACYNRQAPRSPSPSTMYLILLSTDIPDITFVLAES